MIRSCLCFYVSMCVSVANYVYYVCLCVPPVHDEELDEVVVLIVDRLPWCDRVGGGRGSGS